MPQSRKVHEREARQSFILDAARALLDSNHVDEISMDDIATAAQYTRRTLYSYFKSRDDIWLQIHLEDIEKRWAFQLDAIAQCRDGLSKIMTWANAHYAYWKSNPHTMDVELYWDFRGITVERMSASVFDRFEIINSTMAVGLKDFFQSGIEDGSLKADLSIDMCISQFVYTLRAVLRRALSTSYTYTELNSDQYVDHYLGVLHQSICSKTHRNES